MTLTISTISLFFSRDSYVIELLEKAVIFKTKSFSLQYFFLANVASAWNSLQRQNGVPLTKPFLWRVSESQRLMINTSIIKQALFSHWRVHTTAARSASRRSANWPVLQQQLSNSLKELWLAHQNGATQFHNSRGRIPHPWQMLRQANPPCASLACRGGLGLQQ